MSSNTFTLSRGAVYASLITLIWISLPTGIYLAINGSLAWGLLLAVAALVGLVVVASSGLTNTLQVRQIPRSRGYFMLLGFASSVLLTSLYSIMLFEPVRSLALLGTLHAVGALILGSWAAVALLRSITRQGA